MKKNHRILIIIIIILILSALFFSPVKVPYTIDSVAKMLPAHRWVLSRGNDGEIITNTENLVSGLNNSYQITSFERGESIILNLNPTLNDGEIVTKGDTLGVIYSSSQQENLIHLNGELQILNASLNSWARNCKKLCSVALAKFSTLICRISYPFSLSTFESIRKYVDLPL